MNTNKKPCFVRIGGSIDKDLKQWLSDHCRKLGVPESKLIEALIKSHKNDVESLPYSPRLK